MGVQKVILAVRLQVELPSSDLAKKKYATSANLFQKAQLCVAQKMPHQPTFFTKLNYVLPQKCHISQLFSKNSTMCRPKMPHQPTFFKKLNYVSPKKMPHQPPFFKKLNYVSPCHKSVTNVIWQTFSSHLKIGTSVCGLCSQPLKCEL
jgi:hypothetical protein